MIYKLLARVYHKLEENPIIAELGATYLQGLPLGNALSTLRLKRLHQVKPAHGYPIRVVFIQQHKVNWSVVRSIFESMQVDERFSATILTVDEPLDSVPDSAFKNLRNLYGSKCVIKSETDNGYFDLQSLNPDIVFLPRPYDQYLPKCYRSAIVSKYARVAYVPYGFNLIESLEPDVYNGRFCRNISLFFAENEYVANLQRKRYAHNHARGIMHTIISGYPPLSEYANLTSTQDKHDSYRVLWTPRWGDEARMGGSSFLEYRNQFVNYIANEGRLSLVFRPHPLMFDHLIKKGNLTPDQAGDYLSLFSENQRFVYDDSPDIKWSFSNCDVLVTDISSIIVLFYMLDKPIIFCDTGAQLNEMGRKLLEGMYIAHTFADVEKTIKDLLNGHDTLRDTRRQIRSEYLLPKQTQPSDIIRDTLVNAVCN